MRRGRGSGCTGTVAVISRLHIADPLDDGRSSHSKLPHATDAAPARSRGPASDGVTATGRVADRSRAGCPRCPGTRRPFTCSGPRLVDCDPHDAVDCLSSGERSTARRRHRGVGVASRLSGPCGRLPPITGVLSVSDAVGRPVPTQPECQPSSLSGSITTCRIRVRCHVYVMWTRPSGLWMTAGYEYSPAPSSSVCG